MKRTIFVLGVVAIAGVAWAAQLNIDQVTRWAQGGLWVMPHTLAAQTTSTNKVTRMLAAGTGAASVQVDIADTAVGTCTDSSAVSLTGAQAGDPCLLGLPAVKPASADGGLYQGTWGCISAADTVKVRFCNGAAGNIDPLDAGFTFRVISNQ